MSIPDTDMRNIIFLILFVITSCKSPDANKAISKVRLADMEGKPIDLEQFEGRTVFINFWATWCKPCLSEMPGIKKIQDSISKNGIVFLLASDESAAEIIGFERIHSYKFNYTIALNQDELGITSLPTTYIYNPKGELLFSEEGYRNWDDSTNVKMILRINNQK